MRPFLFVSLAFSFVLAVALFPGCGGGSDDGDDNPSSPNAHDTLTTDQVLQEINDVLGSFQSSYRDCDPAYVVAGLLAPETREENLLEVMFLVAVIDSAMRNDGDLSPFYGTWEDTTLQPFDGPTRVGDEPEQAVRVRVLGVDSLGTLHPGDITLQEFLAGGGTDSVRVRASVHADGSPESLSVYLKGELDMASGAGDVKVWAEACGASFYVDLSLQGGGGEAAATVSGWYEYPGDPKLYFEVQGSAEATDFEGSAAGTVHLWTTEDPAFDLVLTMVNDPDTCLTGEIKIDGGKEAEIYMVDCDDDSAVALYIVIDGEAHTGEELLGGIYDILISLDPSQLPGLLDMVTEKGYVPSILWPVGKGHAEALERYRK